MGSRRRPLSLRARLLFLAVCALAVSLSLVGLALDAAYTRSAEADLEAAQQGLRSAGFTIRSAEATVNEAEDNLRRTLTISNGDLSYFFDRPLTLLLATLVILVLISPLLQWWQSRGLQRNA